MNKYIDHTVLKATANKDDITKLCAEAIEYNFKSVCINPTHITLAKECLKDSDVLVCTVVGFPLGANTTNTKAFETSEAVKLGADEIDMVINIGALKDKNYDLVLNDIKAVVKASGKSLVKVIIETCYLTEDEIIKASKLCEEAKAEFVKTSTGFGTDGATPENVELMKKTVPNLEVKAAGGVKNKEDLELMIKKGATRIGTSRGTQLF